MIFDVLVAETILSKNQSNVSLIELSDRN